MTPKETLAVHIILLVSSVAPRKTAMDLGAMIAMTLLGAVLLRTERTLRRWGRRDAARVLRGIHGWGGGDAIVS